MPTASASSENGNNTNDNDGADKTAAPRLVLRSAKTGALGTIDQNTGHPYVSYATIATSIYGAPIFLTSDLALHTQNIRKDPRISLMVHEAGYSGDPLALGRTSLVGTADFDISAVERQRYLSRNPEAAGYAEFADFHFFSMRIEMIHFVGGFGRIYEVDPAEFLTTGTCSDVLVEAEADIIEHMNSDHNDVIQLFATKLLGADAADWKMSGCDIEGCDLIAGGKTLRLAFTKPLESANNVRHTFVELAERARAL